MGQLPGGFRPGSFSWSASAHRAIQRDRAEQRRAGADPAVPPRDRLGAFTLPTTLADQTDVTPLRRRDTTDRPEFRGHRRRGL
jgi:hypothetical protein